MKKRDPKAVRLLSAVIGCTLFLQLLYSPFFSQFVSAVATPELISMLLFLGTGRSAEPAEPVPEATAPEALPEKITFSDADADALTFTNKIGAVFDAQELLLQPLDWSLRSEEPTVLIYHTHTTESYENTENYKESSSYRTLDSKYNMLSIGSHLAERLEEAGIHVIHATNIHDHPDYNSAYSRSKQTVADYMAQYPSIRLVLDLHRDAYEDGQGNQATNTVPVGQSRASKLMFLVGTDIASGDHPGWRDNMALAVKLQALMEQQVAGVCRPITLRSAAFNQFLSPGALLVEVGTAGDTRQNALAAADILADAIIALAQGSQ